jgi:hypothetical protein
MERGGRKIRETGDKDKRKKGGERKKRSGRRLPPVPPHRFRDSFMNVPVLQIILVRLVL